MAITVTPTLPVIATTPGAAAPGFVLQSGTLVNATVLNTLAENLVRIAIAGLSIDVLSEVPLQAGQTLRLAVSHSASSRRASTQCCAGTHTVRGAWGDLGMGAWSRCGPTL